MIGSKTILLGALIAGLIAAAPAAARGGHGGGSMAGSNHGAQLHGLARANQVAGTHGQQGRNNAMMHQQQHSARIATGHRQH